MFPPERSVISCAAPPSMFVNSSPCQSKL